MDYLTIMPDHFDDLEIVETPVTSNHLKMLDDWITKQDKYWPNSLTRDVLAAKLSLVQRPYLWVWGSANGNWSAQIGYRVKYQERCTKCGGRGKNNEGYQCWNCQNGVVEKTRTDWHGEFGVCSTIADGRLEPISSEKIPIPDVYDFKNLASVKLSNFNYPILATPATNQTKAREIAKQILTDDLHANGIRSARIRGDESKNIQIIATNIQIEHVIIWLVPIYIGSFIYEGATLNLWIDPVLNKLKIDTPQSVKHSRQSEVIRATIILILIVVLVIGIIFLSTTVSHCIKYREVFESFRACYDALY